MLLGIDSAIARLVMSKAIKKILLKQGFNKTEFSMKDLTVESNEDGWSEVKVEGTFKVRNEELWQWIGKRL